MSEPQTKPAASPRGTWSFGAVLVAALVGWTAPAAAEVDPRDKGPNTVDVTKYPKPLQEAYEIFKVRCSKCHSLARPINARIEEAAHWKKYLRKMMRKPGSGINKESAKTIYEFLVYYAEQKKKAKK